MNNIILEKYKNLESLLKSYGKISVAFSGGVDSSFLVVAAKKILGKENVLAINLISSMQPKSEENYAKDFADKYDINLIRIPANEYSIHGFVENSKDRCYFCKHAIFSKVIEISKSNGFDIVADGTNSDDEGDYRPGMRALKELSVMSPLKEVGLTKSEIRALLKDMDVETYNKPSAACLASRVPYGTEITREILKQVELSEEYLKSLGFINHRVRYHGNLARIEVTENQFQLLIDNRLEIVKNIKSFGFIFVTCDLLGYTVGSHNLVLKEK